MPPPVRYSSTDRRIEIDRCARDRWGGSHRHPSNATPGSAKKKPPRISHRLTRGGLIRWRTIRRFVSVRYTVGLASLPLSDDRLRCPGSPGASVVSSGLTTCVALSNFRHTAFRRRPVKRHPFADFVPRTHGEDATGRSAPQEGIPPTLCAAFADTPLTGRRDGRSAQRWPFTTNVILAVRR